MRSPTTSSRDPCRSTSSPRPHSRLPLRRPIHIYFLLPSHAPPNLYQWFGDHWLQLLQSAGIIGGLIFTGWNIRLATRARRLTTLLEIAKSHRDIWGRVIGNAGLQGVVSPDRDTVANPLTMDEQVFATLMIIHISCLYEARKAKSVVTLEHLEDDMRDFLCMPVPRTVWSRMKAYQNYDFATFVEGVLVVPGIPTLGPAPIANYSNTTSRLLESVASFDLI